MRYSVWTALAICAAAVVWLILALPSSREPAPGVPSGGERGGQGAVEPPAALPLPHPGLPGSADPEAKPVTQRKLLATPQPFRVASFTSEPSPTGTTSLTIELVGTPGFAHPGVQLDLLPYAAVGLVREVAVPGTITIVEGATAETGFRLPPDLANPELPPLPPGADDLDRALAMLNIGSHTRPLMVNGLPVTSEDALPIAAGSAHELVIEFGPWSWAQLQIPDRGVTPPRCFLDLRFRRLGSSKGGAWRELGDSPSQEIADILLDRDRPFEEEGRIDLPPLPSGRYGFSMPCALPGTSVAWEAELEQGYQVLEAPVPDTFLEIEDPAGFRPTIGEEWMAVWALPWPMRQEELRRGAERHATRRIPFRGRTLAFLPPGRFLLLMRHKSLYRWAVADVDLTEGTPQRLSPDWQESGAARIHIQNWRQPGRFGWVRLIHLDSGWFSVPRTVASDPTQPVFYGLPPGRYQAVWGWSNEAKAVGFSDPFSVPAKVTVQVPFPTSPDGGGALEVVD